MQERRSTCTVPLAFRYPSSRTFFVFSLSEGLLFPRDYFCFFCYTCARASATASRVPDAASFVLLSFPKSADSSKPSTATGSCSLSHLHPQETGTQSARKAKNRHPHTRRNWPDCCV